MTNTVINAADTPSGTPQHLLGVGSDGKFVKIEAASKADSATVTAALESKADSAAVSSALDGKADLVGGKVASGQLPSSDGITEGTSKLYFTAARVLGVLLAGLDTTTNAAVAATDSILVAIGKLQASKISKSSIATVRVKFSAVDGGSGNLNTVAGTVTKIPYDQLQTGASALFSAADSALVAPASGVALITATLRGVQGASSGTTYLMLYKNGAPLQSISVITTTAGGEFITSGGATVPCANGDKFTMMWNGSASVRIASYRSSDDLAANVMSATFVAS